MPRGRRYSWEYFSIASPTVGVDDGQQFGQVLGENLEVQGFVAVVQLFQIDVLGQVGALHLHLLVGTPSLLVQGEHSGGQAPGETEGLAFLRYEGHSTIAQRVQQDAGGRRGPRVPLGHRILPL